MTSVLHLAFAVGGSFVMWRAAVRVAQGAPDEAVAAAFPLAILIATAFGSFAALIAGRSAWTARRALTLDAITLGGAAWWLAVLTLGPWTRDLGGVSLVCIAAARLAPAALAVASMRAPTSLAFVVALGGYGALAAWLPAASLPLGDQVHYLLAADRLLQGSLDATLDGGLFRSILGIAPGPADVATHVADTPLGPRPIQGYAMPLLLLPGWALAGRLGAHLTMAAVAAWVSYQTFLILRDLTMAARRGLGGDVDAAGTSSGLKNHVSPSIPVWAAGWTWILASFLAPLPLLATHLYPNAVGAALIATAFRVGFTASVVRPAVAAALLALTLFLTPRDGVALAVLLPFLFWPAVSLNRIGAELNRIGAIRRGSPHDSPASPHDSPASRGRIQGVALAAGGIALAAVVANALTYGLPVPYAGYAFGTAQAQELTREPSITPRVWLGLPAILFDRTFGLAGTAPWVFIGLLGLLPLLRLERTPLATQPAARAHTDPAASRPVLLPAASRPVLPPAASRPVLLPAALTVGASVLALSFFRLWEGGYAPPNRYFVDVLPLWAPFVAFGLAAAAGRLRVDRGGKPVDPLAVGWLVRAGVGVAIFTSAVAAVVLNGIPTTALNTAFDHQVRDALGRILGLDPLGWLPSFQPMTPDWYVGAYLQLIPAVLIAAGLVVLGHRVWLRKGSGASHQIGAIPHQFGAEHAGTSTGTPATLTHQADARSQPWDADPHQFDANFPRSRTPTPPAALTGWAGSFAALNAVFIALALVAAWQPWVTAGAGPVSESLFRKWLPLALALAAVGTLLVARLLPPVERELFLRRHLFVYAVPLALMLVAHTGAGLVLNAQLGAVYLVIAAVFALNTLTGMWRTLPDDSGLTSEPPSSGDGDRRTDLGDRRTELGDGRTALHLALMTLVVFLVLLPYHRAVMPTASDEPHYLLITQSIIYDGDVDLRNDYEGNRYSAFYPARLPDMHGIEIGRAVYPIRDLGLPVLSALPFALGGRLGVLALMCIVGAALVAQLYLLLRDLRFAPRVAFLAVATTALTHPVLTYTTQVYPELLTALVFVSVARLLRRGAAASVRDLALASGLVALLPVLSTRAWPIAVGLGLVVAYAALRPVWAAWRRDRGHLESGETVGPAADAEISARQPHGATLGAMALRVGAAALPFIVIVGALAFANWLMFGVFLPSAGYYIIREQQQVLAYAPHVGGIGLVFDRVFGLIPRAPVYLLGFLGIAALVRHAWPRDDAAADPELRGHGPELAALALGGLLSFAYIANIAYWWADGSPPSRYLLGAIPLFVAAVAGGWEVVLGADRPITRPAAGPPRLARLLSWLAWATVVASAAVAYVYAMQPNIRYDLALDIRASGSTGSLFAFLDQRIGLDPGVWFPSMVQPDLTALLLVIGWAALALALVVIGSRFARRASLVRQRQQAVADRPR